MADAFGMEATYNDNIQRFYCLCGPTKIFYSSHWAVRKNHLRDVHVRFYFKMSYNIMFINYVVIYKLLLTATDAETEAKTIEIRCLLNLSSLLPVNMLR